MSSSPEFSGNRNAGFIDDIIPNNQNQTQQPQLGTYTQRYIEYSDRIPGEPIPFENFLLFSDESIRFGFVRKVFLILLLQLVSTFGLVSLLTFHTGINDGIKDSNIFLYISIVMAVLDLILIGVIAIKPKFVKKSPINYISLGLVTLCTALPLSAVTVYFETKLGVVIVMGMMLAMVFSLLLFTLQSRKELGYLAGFLVITVSTIVAGVILYFSLRNEESDVLYIVIAAGVATFVFGMIWVAIIRGIMFGGKDSCSPEDFILASMLLYVTAILIFLVILLCVAAASGGGNSNIRVGGCGGYFWFFPVYYRAPYTNRQVKNDENEEDVKSDNKV